MSDGTETIVAAGSVGCIVAVVMTIGGYLGVGVMTATLFLAMDDGFQTAEMFGVIVISWPLWWVMAFIFIAASGGAPH